MGADLPPGSLVQIRAFFSVAFPVAYAYGQICSSFGRLRDLLSYRRHRTPVCDAYLPLPVRVSRSSRLRGGGCDGETALRSVGPTSPGVRGPDNPLTQQNLFLAGTRFSLTLRSAHQRFALVGNFAQESMNTDTEALCRLPGVPAIVIRFVQSGRLD